MRTVRGERLLLWIIVLGGAAYVAAFLSLSRQVDYDLPGGLAIAPAIVLLGAVIVRHLAHLEDDPVIARVVLWSAALKVAATLANYAVTYGYYGRGDATQYHQRGAVIAAQLRSLDASPLFDSSNLLGTPFMELVTGAAYVVIGPTRFGAFFLFSAFAWAGVYLFWRAFKMAVPDGVPRRYAALLFLWPSLLYWPANLGKESWMLLMLGLVVFGVARLFNERRGLAPFLAGLLGMTLLRPHIALLIVLAIAVSLVSVRVQRSGLGIGTRVVGGALLTAAGLFVVFQTQAFFELERIGFAEAEMVFEDVAENTRRGGSQFTNVGANNPLLFPVAFVSVMLRPFPWEAANPLALALSLEGLLLVALAIRLRRSVYAWGRGIASNPYLAFGVVYLIAFVLAFSSFNNLGLLARERVMALPFLFVALAFPAAGEERATATPPTAAGTSRAGRRGSLRAQGASAATHAGSDPSATRKRASASTHRSPRR